MDFNDFLKMVNHYRNQDYLDKIRNVNMMVNGMIQYISDFRKHGLVDYWQSPGETLFDLSGDCEDSVILKYFGLRHLEIARVWLTYCMKIKDHEFHMVLTCMDKNSDYGPLFYSECEVLDLPDHPAIKKVKDRKDIIPVYSFNEYEFFVDKGDFRKRVEQLPDKMKKWQEVLSKTKKEMV